jgi:hypothetical protein
MEEADKPKVNLNDKFKKALTKKLLTMNEDELNK